MVFSSRIIEPKSLLPYLEYIESTGTQYIDTSFAPNQNSRIIMDAAVMNVGQEINRNGIMFGCANPQPQDGLECYVWGGQLIAFYKEQQLGSFPSVAVGDRLLVDFNKNVFQCTRNSNILSSYTWTPSTFQSRVSLMLFALPRSTWYYGSLKLYSCQIYDNGTLILDYHPVKDPNGVVCLYEQVNQQYVYNAGTGEFIAGPEL